MLNGLPCMDYPKWTTPKLVANIVSRTKRFSAFFPRANWSEINRRSRFSGATILSLADCSALLPNLHTAANQALHTAESLATQASGRNANIKALDKMRYSNT